MKKIFSFCCLFLLIWLVSCSSRSDKSAEAPQTDANAGKKAEIIAENLDVPWSINKSGDTIFLSERTGSIVKIENKKQMRMKVELKEPLAKVPEAGLLGFVLHPEFNENGKAFAYYTYEKQGMILNRIVNLVLEGDFWKEDETLLDSIPGGQFHQGGRLKVGPDGKLYASTGDATKEEMAQNPDLIGGKILRLNLDGSIPGDNPFDNSYVYSYGHRNPQGLSWSEDHVLYSTEHGPDGYDEINRIEPGKNYGWPTITGSQKKAGITAPLIHSGKPSWAPSGSAYSAGTLYFGALGGESVKSYSIRSGKLRTAIHGYGRIRDVLIDGDTMYFATNNTDGRGVPFKKDDKLYKLNVNQISD
ncbi:PQQ-dependent sugar dehydrogenase [Bacillus sp. SJS]|uniref:PQQ-dependent sugar dehydrogenase n=1 Tax=Bacillus sp. SJS TaxID=1423321 RepID=UPI0004DCC030|nr:PQQ-dependent sugar dehydrogenase [Bacillus sp. SJS]KZZ82627.1 quinoprotein glucose dehydrogenase [Bacillus sp. SJS]